MAAVRNIRSVTPQVWIPPAYTANWKMTVEREDGTIDDITDIIQRAEIIESVTDGIGSFEFIFPNPNETYTGVYTGMEIFKYYSDYSSGTPSTLRFRGRIEKPSYKNSTVHCTGRTDALFIIDQNVNKSYTNVDCADVLRDMYASYDKDGRFNTSGIVSSTGVTITVDWNKSFQECVEDLCLACAHAHYIDANLIANLFVVGDRINTEDAIVHEHNMIEVGDFADDVTFVRNKVTIYGANFNGIQILYTTENKVSQAKYGIKELKITDENINVYAQAVNFADSQLAEGINPPKVGEIKGLLLATIQPGEAMRLSAPYDNLPNGTYNTTKYKHEFDVDAGFYTTVTVSKEPRKLSSVLKQRVEAENRQQDTHPNPYDMQFSFPFFFDTDEGSHTSTEIVSSVLKLQDGQTVGAWVSPVRNTATNVTQVYVIADGQSLTGATFEVSANNGVSYQVVSLKTLTNITTAAGTGLRIKVTIVDANTQIDGLSVMYKETT
jgi:hypothetical protein